MTSSMLLRSVAVGAVSCVLGHHVHAQTIQSLGAGSAVTWVDRSATFDALAVNGTPLSDYTEGGLFIGTNADSTIGTGYPVALDPFHIPGIPSGPFYCPDGGSQGWCVLRTTDGKPIYGVEFLYGNGWTTGDIYGQYPWGNSQAVLEWEVWSGGAVTSSGIVGSQYQLNVGETVGFYDRAGFDEIWMKCTIATAWDPTFQVLAMDNLNVQLRLCPADYNADGFVDGMDYDLFNNDFESYDPAQQIRADYNHDGFVDGLDYDLFNNDFAVGC